MVVCRVTRAAPRSAPQPVRDGSASVKSSRAATQGPTRASFLSVSPPDLAPSAAAEKQRAPDTRFFVPAAFFMPRIRPRPLSRRLPTLHEAHLCQQGERMIATVEVDGSEGYLRRRLMGRQGRGRTPGMRCASAGYRSHFERRQATGAQGLDRNGRLLLNCPARSRASSAASLP